MILFLVGKNIPIATGVTTTEPMYQENFILKDTSLLIIDCYICMHIGVQLFPHIKSFNDD